MPDEREKGKWTRERLFADRNRLCTITLRRDRDFVQTRAFCLRWNFSNDIAAPCPSWLRA